MNSRGKVSKTFGSLLNCMIKNIHRLLKLDASRLVHDDRSLLNPSMNRYSCTETDPFELSAVKMHLPWIYDVLRSVQPFHQECSASVIHRV